jgi:hypothetical protein
MGFSFQDAFNVALLVAGMLCGFILRATWDAIRELRKEITEMHAANAAERTAIANTYQRRDDADRTSQATLNMLAEIRHSIGTLHDKLDRKADR